MGMFRAWLTGEPPVRLVTPEQATAERAARARCPQCGAPRLSGPCQASGAVRAEFERTGRPAGRQD